MAISDDASLESILGTPRRGRPQLRKNRSTLTIRREPEEVEGPEDSYTGSGFDAQRALTGVSLSWLATAFQQDFRAVRRKLADCPPFKKLGGKPLYLVSQAAPYLVTPKVDVEKYIRDMDPDQLPPALQKEFWLMMLNRQKWERQAGELWHTQDVMDVLGEVFKTLKNSIQLWIDTMERMPHGLSDEQRETLQRLTDSLQADMHRGLVELADTRKTESSREQELTKLGA